MLDNAFGSGSFLVAALLEGRNFVGIERNRDAELFRNEKIDYLVSATERLGEAWNQMDGKTKESVRVINLMQDFEDGVENLPGLLLTFDDIW